MNYYDMIILFFLLSVIPAFSPSSEVITISSSLKRKHPNLLQG